MKYLGLFLRVILGIAMFMFGGLIVSVSITPVLAMVLSPEDCVTSDCIDFFWGIRALITMAGGALTVFFARGFFSKLDRFDNKPPIYKSTPQITHIETTSTKPSDLEEEAQKTIRNCPKCRTSITSEALFCTSCGTDLRLKTCLNCDTENPTEATFCMSCGKEL